MDPFKVLAIAPTDDLRAIKKAYAAKLKQNRPDKNPEGYQYLREAFDLAKTIAQQHAVTSPDQYSPATLDNRITLSPEAAPAMTATAAPPPTSQTVAVTAVSDNADEAADQREPVVVSVCAEEMPDAEPEVPRVAPAELVNSLLSGIHDELVDFGDVAGFSKFLDTWNSETLIPINLSRLFEEHTCEYLTWLLHQVKDGKTDWFPSGFVRQVYRHYGWHQSRHLS